jgi:hypothetical protein
MTYGRLFPLLQGNKSLTFSKVKGRWYVMKDNGTKVEIPCGDELHRFKIEEQPWNSNQTVVKTTGRELKKFNLKHFGCFDTVSIHLDSKPRLYCGTTDDSIILSFPEKKGEDRKAHYSIDYMRQIIRCVPTSTDVELGIGQDDSPLRLNIYEGQGTIYLAPVKLQEE